MHKYKNYLKLLLFVFLPSLIFPADVLVEGKAAYFHPTNSRLKEIYSGGGIYGAELSVQAWKELYPWISADYFSQSGRSVIDGGGSSMRGNKTEIHFVPIAAGLKYLKQVSSNFDVYFSAGATATYLHIKNHLRTRTQVQTNWGPGFTCKIGTLAYIYKGLFLDFAIDYRYAKVSFSKPCCAANLSGFSFGGGLGYRF